MMRTRYLFVFQSIPEQMGIRAMAWMTCLLRLRTRGTLHMNGHYQTQRRSQNRAFAPDDSTSSKVVCLGRPNSLPRADLRSTQQCRRSSNRTAHLLERENHSSHSMRLVWLVVTQAVKTKTLPERAVARLEQTQENVNPDSSLSEAISAQTIAYIG